MPKKYTPPDIAPFVAFLTQSAQRLVKVEVVPLLPKRRLGGVYEVSGYVTLPGALKHRTPEAMIEDLGLLTVEERLAYGFLDAKKLWRSGIPFGGVPSSSKIEGVNILKLLHIPDASRLEDRGDSRLPGGADFHHGNGYRKDYWLPGSGLPQWKLTGCFHASMIGFCPSGVRWV